jgi:hypothetical protein
LPALAALYPILKQFHTPSLDPVALVGSNRCWLDLSALILTGLI